MATRQAFLGAAANSCRRRVPEAGANRTATSHRARKRPNTTIPSRERSTHSLWHFSGVEARAFNFPKRSSSEPPLLLRVSMFMSLALYERRTHPSGEAVCLLGLRRGRFFAGIAGVVIMVVIVGALSPYACAALATAIVALLSPRAIEAVREPGHAARLETFSPPGSHVYVHSLASTLPGAGAELMRHLVYEADSKRWSLVLDASNQRLARYYESFGFQTLGTAVRMPNGSSHVRMWRPALALDEPGQDGGIDQNERP
jgi:hypothetical protein